MIAFSFMVWCDSSRRRFYITSNVTQWTKNVSARDHFATIDYPIEKVVPNNVRLTNRRTKNQQRNTDKRRLNGKKTNANSLDVICIRFNSIRRWTARAIDSSRTFSMEYDEEKKSYYERYRRQQKHWWTKDKNEMSTTKRYVNIGATMYVLTTTTCISKL